MKKLILATDGSDSAMRALSVAVRLATAFDAELRLIHVMQDLGLSREELQAFCRAENISLADALAAQAEEVLAKARSKAIELGARRLSTEAASGDPTDIILKIAERENADAIVVGKRGWGPVRGMLLGSVSQKLASLARCPVLVVP